MPKREDIKSILIIGAGPIIIGQACEFDYSGTQACKALKEDGYRIILVNSNPATIMTDPEMADATYMEPITPEIVAKIIEKERHERPDDKLALLPTMGGQTALNCALSLQKMGVLKKFDVEMIGADAKAIDKAEDRELFRSAMDKIGLKTPDSMLAHNMSEALEALDKIGLPAIIRPSFTMGGTGGGIAYNRDEYIDIIERGLDASPTTEVLIEVSIVGWKEYEMEVVRDKNDNCIIVCAIENIDPMGVHTGDSITVAPALTLTDKEYQIMRDASLAVLREIGIETGGSNVQFAVNPADGSLVVIEMNPRVSRSSALASKATGFPIAKVAARLAVGYTLDELDNDITLGATPASFEPSIDYVVTKIPRFAFEKFSGASNHLTSAMKSVGEAMAIGRNMCESLQKALRSLETGLTGFNEIGIPGIDKNTSEDEKKHAIRAALSNPTPERLLYVGEAMRLGMSNEDIFDACFMDPWFLEQIRTIIDMEEKVRKFGLPTDIENFRHLKSLGFSDARLAELLDSSEGEVRASRRKLGLRPVYKRIDTCAAEFAAPTAYMYSTYEAPFAGKPVDEANPSNRKKVVILGGGPNRIGQGIEFDYCCCHAAFALGDNSLEGSDEDYETIMVNCNPETVSTDYDTSDRLYFEPLTAEDVTEILETEKQDGTLHGVIVQFGGQTPLGLASAVQSAGVPILGTQPSSIDLAEDRDLFSSLLRKLDLTQPDNSIAHSLDEARNVATKIGFPLVIRPSFVLGGRAMAIIHNQEAFERYMETTLHDLVPPSIKGRFPGDAARQIDSLIGKNPLLFDSYLDGAIEIDVDCLSDGEEVFVCGIMEHIEEAGVHSGDSACSLPPRSLDKRTMTQLKEQTAKMALALGVVGLMNVQFALKDGIIYVLEVNPRASRTVPFVAKVIGKPIAKIAARLMAGEKLSSFDLKDKDLNHIGIKEAVFPFGRFPGVDTVLGPEMKSTGEVIGLDTDFAVAFAKSQLGSSIKVPKSGTAFVSVRDEDKTPALAKSIGKLADSGFSIIATSGTMRFLVANDIKCKKINKVMEGRPHIVDAIKNGEVQLLINTTQGQKALSDSSTIRRSALLEKVPYYTTIPGAIAAIDGIIAYQKGILSVRTLQEYLA